MATIEINGVGYKVTLGTHANGSNLKSKVLPPDDEIVEKLIQLLKLHKVMDDKITKLYVAVEIVPRKKEN